MGLMNIAWAVAYTAAAAVGRWTRPDDSPISLVWPAAGVAVLWVLYARDGRRLVAAMVLGVLATAVNLATGADATQAVQLAGANVVHAVVAVLVLEHHLKGRRARLADTADLARLGVAAVAGAAASLPLGLLVWVPATGGHIVASAGAWMLRYGVATAVVTAIALTSSRWRSGTARQTTGGTAELVLAALATAAAYAAVFFSSPGETYAFLVLPLTVWVAVRMGPFATALLGAFAGSVAVVSALGDTGPFGTITGALEQSVVVQSFVAVVGVVGLALSLTVQDRRHALQRAGDARDALQQALDGAMVGQVIVGLDDDHLADGRILFANKAFCEWYGDDALLNRSFLDLVVDQDSVGAERMLQALAAGQPSWYGELGLATPAGVRWCEVAAAHLPATGGLTASAQHHATIQLLDVSARREFADRLTHQALHDDLTGLPNRVLLRERLEHSLAMSVRSGRTVGVVFIDLDHFKTVNDSLGHSAGDTVIRTVAERLAAGVRPSDTVARVGGDEFVVCIPDGDGAEQAADIANRLLVALNEPITLPGRPIMISASAGIALSGAHDTADDLVRKSDTAMYAAKTRGRGRVEFYEDALYKRAQRQLDIVHDARHGLAREEFVLHYQPVVSLTTAGADWDAAQFVGVEALVRWQHPERGLLPPGDWLDVVETSDVMNDLGTWVLRTAAEAVASVDSLAAHVNVSAAQLRHDLVATVTAALDDSGLSAERLVLELTETQLVAVHPDLLVDLRRLCDLGVKLSVDDFGTHYSSLTQLTTLPVTGLKVDRSFVMAMDVDDRARAIVHGVLGMAGAMGLDVVAEGVENADAATDLRRWGCPNAQGYLWGRPQPWHQLRDRLADRSLV
jgi:diguanylate cyclase (GGDEF)-like protein